MPRPEPRVVYMQRPGAFSPAWNASAQTLHNRGSAARGIEQWTTNLPPIAPRPHPALNAVTVAPAPLGIVADLPPNVGVPRAGDESAVRPNTYTGFENVTRGVIPINYLGPTAITPITMFGPPDPPNYTLVQAILPHFPSDQYRSLRHTVPSNGPVPTLIQANFAPTAVHSHRDLLHGREFNSAPTTRFAPLVSHTGARSRMGRGCVQVPGIGSAPWATSGLPPMSVSGHRLSTCSTSIDCSGVSSQTTMLLPYNVLPARSVIPLQSAAPVSPFTHNPSVRLCTIVPLRSPHPRQNVAGFDEVSVIGLQTVPSTSNSCTIMPLGHPHPWQNVAEFDEVSVIGLQTAPATSNSETRNASLAFAVPRQRSPEHRLGVPGIDASSTLRPLLDPYGRTSSVGEPCTPVSPNANALCGTPDWRQVVRAMLSRIIPLLLELSHEITPRQPSSTLACNGLTLEEIINGMEWHFCEDTAALQRLIPDGSWKTAVHAVLNSAREIIRIPVEEGGLRSIRYRPNAETDLTWCTAPGRPIPDSETAGPPSQTFRVTSPAAHAPGVLEFMIPKIWAEANELAALVSGNALAGERGMDGVLKAEQGCAETKAGSIPPSKREQPSALPALTTASIRAGEREATAAQEQRPATEVSGAQSLAILPPTIGVLEHVPVNSKARDQPGGGQKASDTEAASLHAIDWGRRPAVSGIEMMDTTGERAAIEKDIMELGEQRCSKGESGSTGRPAQRCGVAASTERETPNFQDVSVEPNDRAMASRYDTEAVLAGGVDDAAEKEAARDSQSTVPSTADAPADEHALPFSSYSLPNEAKAKTRKEFEDTLEELSRTLSAAKAEEGAAEAEVALLLESLKVYKERQSFLSGWLATRTKKTAAAARATAAAFDAWSANPASKDALELLWTCISVICNLARVEIVLPEGEQRSPGDAPPANNKAGDNENAAPPSAAADHGQQAGSSSAQPPAEAACGKNHCQLRDRRPVAFARLKKSRGAGTAQADIGDLSSRSSKRRAVGR